MKKKFIISFLISFLCFSLIFLTFGEFLFARQKSTAAIDESEDDGELDLGEDNIIEQRVKNEILFLLVGVDAKSVKKSKGTRTDTMMLMKVNFDTGEINLLSIPRDTRVLVKGKQSKINSAHAIGGMELTMKTVRDFLNLDVDYYVKIDYQFVIDVVDEIGGVTIDVPMNMDYDDPAADPPLHIHIPKGVQTLDGQKAHDFLRWRKNNNGPGYADGDIGRIKTQQMFLKELIKQTLQWKNITKLPKLVNTYFDYVETNIPKTVILKGAMAATKIDPEKMVANTIPGEAKTIDGQSFWIYDKTQTEALVKEMFGDYLLGQ